MLVIGGRVRVLELEPVPARDPGGAHQIIVSGPYPAVRVQILNRLRHDMALLVVNLTVAEARELRHQLGMVIRRERGF